MVQDFMAWTITHTHQIRVTATVCHDESGHVFNMETRFPFNVLAPDQSVISKRTREILPANGALHQGAGEHEAENPPVYDEETPVYDEKRPPPM